MKECLALDQNGHLAGKNIISMEGRNANGEH